MGRTERKNVIVVGAGASREFGLPTGKELKDRISEICNIRFHNGRELAYGDRRLFEALLILAEEPGGRAGDVNPLVYSSRMIAENMPVAPSIDNFLDTHRIRKDIVEIGKLAVAKAIIDAERSSDLWVNYAQSPAFFDIRRISQTWLGKFFSILVEQRSIDDYFEALENITFVSFNYDRCIEQCLTFLTKKYFGCELSETDIAKHLDIVHPYGSLGSLAWANPTQNGFGAELRAQELIDISRGISTFTEGAESQVRRGISHAMDGAEVVIFLGFSFLPLNMTLLFGEQRFSGKTVFATGKGLSGDSRRRVESELSERLSGGVAEVAVKDMTCGELFHEYHRFLQGS